MRLWLAAMGALVLAGVIVPYGLLAGRAGSLSVALVWSLFGLAVIAMILAAVSRWRPRP